MNEFHISSLFSMHPLLFGTRVRPFSKGAGMILGRWPLPLARLRAARAPGSRQLHGRPPADGRSAHPGGTNGRAPGRSWACPPPAARRGSGGGRSRSRTPLKVRRSKWDLRRQAGGSAGGARPDPSDPEQKPERGQDGDEQEATGVLHRKPAAAPGVYCGRYRDVWRVS